MQSWVIAERPHRLSDPEGIMRGMAGLDQLRFVRREPDEELTALGQFAGSVVADCLRDLLAPPRLHLGLNTLPDPPVPIVAHVPLAIPEDAWPSCDEDLLAFLDTAGRMLSNQWPSPDSAFDPATRNPRRMLRPDSIALVWKARMVVAADGDASLILVRELMEGSELDQSYLDPTIGRPGLMAWAIDRAGFGLLAWSIADVPDGPISVGDEVLDPDDEVFRLLATILATQYAWASHTFGC
jgi:hypothetical protein